MCNTTKQNYSVQATYTPTDLTQLNDTLPITSIKLHTTTKLPPAGNEYFCFHINGKSPQDYKCVKYRITTKVINYTISIDTFEQQCVVLKYMLQLPRLKYHMKNIGIDQSVRNRDYLEHKCLNNIKRYTNMLVNVMTNKHLKILWRLLWFLLQKK